MGFRLTPCCNTDGIPMYVINEFLKEIEIDVLVELGTAGGASTIEAAKHFKEVITVELNEDRPKYDQSLTNVQWINGNSIDVLPEIINELIDYKEKNSPKDHRYAMFFIDSHFDGDKPKDSPYKDCYLLEELEIISRYAQDAIIIIDDARLFLGNPPQPNNAKEWPTVQEIFSFLESSFQYHYFTIIDDYIISMPDRIKWIFDKIWMESYDRRFPNDKERVRNAVKLTYNSFLNYIQ